MTANISRESWKPQLSLALRGPELCTALEDVYTSWGAREAQEETAHTEWACPRLETGPLRRFRFAPVQPPECGQRHPLPHSGWPPFSTGKQPPCWKRHRRRDPPMPERMGDPEGDGTPMQSMGSEHKGTDSRPRTGHEVQGLETRSERPPGLVS